MLPNISQLLQPLDDALRTNLIPAVTGQPAPNNLERDLFALRAQHGGLGIRVPSKVAESELLASQKVTSTLIDHIIFQDNEYGYGIVNDQMQAKSKIRQENQKRDQDEAQRIYTQLPDRLQKAVTLSREKGASTWLTTLPLTEHGFTLHKSAFHDALALRYGWVPAHHYPANVPVGTTSVWNMHYPVQGEDSLPSDITKYEILLPLYSQKSALRCVLNQICSQLHPTYSLGLQPTARMVQGWTCQPTASGVADSRKLTLK